MARIFCIASLALAAVSAVSGHVIPHTHKRGPPAGWQAGILQNYTTYHERYLNWDCDKQHNTDFFEKCCHPLLKHESLSVLDSLGCGCDNDDGDSPAVPSPTPSSSSQPSHKTPSYNTPSNTPSSPASSPTTPVETPKDNVAPPAVEPTSTSHTSSSPSPSPPAQTSGSNDGGQAHNGGIATFFYQNGAPGACGKVHQDTDFICAMDQDLYNRQLNSDGESVLCGQQVKITLVSDKTKSVTVTVADDCPTCQNTNSIDLSLAAFQKLASLDKGDVAISWEFVNN
ncbi:plant expansin [Russula ochroleuca]|jgi:hypothetical protein|uniref:Plant expansin n=1 Tax=Russula ochroleuca TaxID=152965 RepID=A0A9P5MTZ1_9AGAM|nr:plant expansin [Russula ochroleuca]